MTFSCQLDDDDDNDALHLACHCYAYPIMKFVIVASMDHTDPRLNVEERVALALKRCGVSITCKAFNALSMISRVMGLS